MGAAFDRAVYVFSFRCAFPGGRTPDTLFSKLFKTRVQAQIAADEVPNWSSQKPVEITVRLYHPDQEDGDQGMPTAQWQRVEPLDRALWLPVPPTPLGDLSDPAERVKLDGTLKR